VRLKDQMQSLTTHINSVKELARPDSDRLVDELKRVIRDRWSATSNKGHTMVTDMLILVDPQSQEMKEFIELVGALERPTFQEGVIKAVLDH
jgi:hypothetical protein